MVLRVTTQVLVTTISTDSSVPGSNYNGEGSIDITQASNDKLTWEKVSKLNIGLNFGSFNRVTVDANFYRNETSDMLMEIPYSMTTGFTSGMGNIQYHGEQGFRRQP